MTQSIKNSCFYVDEIALFQHYTFFISNKRKSNNLTDYWGEKTFF